MYIGSSWNLETACIGVDELESETAHGHANLLNKFLDRFAGCKEKLVGFLNDNTVVMPATANLMNLPFFGCFPHDVNLVLVSELECPLLK